MIHDDPLHFRIIYLNKQHLNNKINKLCYGKLKCRWILGKSIQIIWKSKGQDKCEM